MPAEEILPICASSTFGHPGPLERVPFVHPACFLAALRIDVAAAGVDAGIVIGKTARVDHSSRAASPEAHSHVSEHSTDLGQTCSPSATCAGATAYQVRDERSLIRAKKEFEHLQTVDVARQLLPADVEKAVPIPSPCNEDPHCQTNQFRFSFSVPVAFKCCRFDNCSGWREYPWDRMALLRAPAKHENSQRGTTLASGHASGITDKRRTEEGQ